MSDTSFDSSDSVRSGRPLRHLKKAEFDRPFKLQSGGELPRLTVAYEVYGELNAAKDNAIWVCHAISGDSHVARHDENDDPGWWDIMVGPGRPIDTNRFFVICPNLLGGCRGTTGPGSVNPRTGKRYGPDFPNLTIADMVDAQRLLLDELEIPQLLAVVGGSVGGHQAMTWATRYPDRVRAAVVLASSPRLTSQALAFDVVGRNAIISDPKFEGGHYYDKGHGGPGVGLAIARMIGHITYLSPEAMKEKFDADRLKPRDVAIEFEKRFSVGTYLGYHGTRFVERFDANSYIALSLAMDLFDLGQGPALAQTFSRARCRWLVVSFSSDWLFLPEQSQEIVDALVANRAPVSYCNVQSNCGHDAFLLANDFHVYGEMVRHFVNHVAATPPAPAPEAERPPGPTSIFRQHRLDYDRIVELIPPGSSVLDLGCGSGGLLARLRASDHRRLVGAELDEMNILTCLSRGLDVVQADLNRGIGSFARGEFDYVVLSKTLQAIYNVEKLISEILEIGKTCIVSIPNFAYRPLRKMLAEEGRAPKGGVLHYEWYNTPNVRFFTIADFRDFCRCKSIRVLKQIALDTEADRQIEEDDDPNLNADLAIFVISRG